MPRQTVVKEIDDLRTPTGEYLSVRFTVEVEGRRNVPNMENLGKALDSGAWLIQRELEASYIHDKLLHQAEKLVIRQQIQDKMAIEIEALAPAPNTPTPTTTPTPDPNPNSSTPDPASNSNAVSTLFK